MTIKYAMALPLFPHEEHEAILARFREILEGREVLSMGKQVAQFESAFAAYSGVKYGVATNSCSAALEIALRTMNLTSGDEVIVPAETFIATASAVVREGGTPVFADIHPDTFCLSAEGLSRKITPRTKAVILVHMAGLITPEVTEIQSLCRKHSLTLIEDAAHAPGAAFRGEKAGSFGHMACFSFYPTKVMTTGEGGMLLTKDHALYERASGLRHRGLQTGAGREIYADIGSNNRMTEFAAILGLSQLKYLDAFIAARNKIARAYAEELQGTPGLEPLPLPPQSVHSYWRYIVKTAPGIDRQALRAFMAQRGIALDWAYDPPVHLQPVFLKLYGNREGLLPETEKIMSHFVCLPIHPGIKRDEARMIAQSLKEGAESLHGR